MLSIAASVLSVSLLPAVPQDPPAARLAPALQTPPPLPGRTPGTERWIVVLREPAYDLEAYAAAVRAESPTAVQAAVAELEARARADQAEVVALAERLGGRVLEQWWLVDAFAVEIPRPGLQALRAHPRVGLVHADFARRPGEVIKTSTNPRNHATDLVQALGVRGKGVTVAVLDSGVDSDMNGAKRPHATFYPGGDIKNRTGGGLGGSRLLANVQVGRQPADDIIAHGTAVAGVAVGARWNKTPAADDGHAPEAKLVSYAVADFPNGLTTITTLLKAWQRIAADRTRYSIDVVVVGYEGYASPQIADMQALDALARNGDVVVAGLAGNGGSSSEYGFGATNMMAVGATHPDTRKVAAFSSRGPLAFSQGRFYPDLVANGVGMDMPLADAEATHKTAQGTSYAAPQVGGAAALYRSLRPGASALEVKAAILATTEDVSAKNPNPPFNSRNAYGAGYLRVDRLVKVARGAGWRLESSLSSTKRAATLRVPVVIGHRYTAVVTWFRANTARRAWANLDLSAAFGGRELASSKGLQDVTEIVRFQAPSNGVADVTVTAASFEGGANAQRFSLVVVDERTGFVPGAFSTYGAPCRGRSYPTLGPGLRLPEIGIGYDVTVRAVGFPPHQPAVLVVGASRTSWLGLKLPLDLSPIGATGCLLYTSAELFVNVPYTTGGGVRHVTILLPNDPDLVGARLYHQAAAADPPANALGVAFSNGLEATIGGER